MSACKHDSPTHEVTSYWYDITRQKDTWLAVHLSTDIPIQICNKLTFKLLTAHLRREIIISIPRGISCIVISANLAGSRELRRDYIRDQFDCPNSTTFEPGFSTKLLACVYEGQLLDKLHLLYCGITRTSTLPTCMTHTHTWEQGHVAVRAGGRERCLMNLSQNAGSWSACSWLLYCSMQRVMFRPCTHMADHVPTVQSESDMIEYVSLRDWPYVNSDRIIRQNVINSWLTLCYMNGAHFHGYICIL